MDRDDAALRANVEMLQEQFTRLKNYRRQQIDEANQELTRRQRWIEQLTGETTPPSEPSASDRNLEAKVNH
jgi:hypothetical protein